MLFKFLINGMEINSNCELIFDEISQNLYGIVKGGSEAPKWRALPDNREPNSF